MNKIFVKNNGIINVTDGEPLEMKTLQNIRDRNSFQFSFYHEKKLCLKNIVNIQRFSYRLTI